ncbi:MAG: hypothetical protein AAF600_16435 [Bacteroidota bacterium]
MPRFLILLFIFIAFGSTGQSLKLSELDSSEYFDFWEGMWSATWEEGDTLGKGINELTWIMGRKVLQENFRILKGQSKGFMGGSLSVFQPQTRTWRQAWADNQGGYYDFIGDFDGDKRIFKTHPREINNQKIVQRMVFYDIKNDSFTWDWELSRDGGKTWNLSWRIHYERM